MNDTTQQPDAQAAYQVPAFRFTISLDVAAGNATIAAQRVMLICQTLAQLCTDPLGGRALHDAMGGAVLNIVSFNDPTPVTEPVNPAELSALQDAVRAMQSGDPQALAGLAQLFGGGAGE
jgi:hypothetical protein